MSKELHFENGEVRDAEADHPDCPDCGAPVGTTDGCTTCTLVRDQPSNE